MLASNPDVVLDAGDLPYAGGPSRTRLPCRRPGSWAPQGGGGAACSQSIHSCRATLFGMQAAKCGPHEACCYCRPPACSQLRASTGQSRRRVSYLLLPPRRPLLLGRDAPGLQNSLLLWRLGSEVQYHCSIGAVPRALQQAARVAGPPYLSVLAAAGRQDSCSRLPRLRCSVDAALTAHRSLPPAGAGTSGRGSTSRSLPPCRSCTCRATTSQASTLHCVMLAHPFLYGPEELPDCCTSLIFHVHLHEPRPSQPTHPSKCTRPPASQCRLQRP